MKNLLVLLLILSFSPAFAGVYEDAMKSDKDVMLYLYTSYCRTCKVVAPYFDEVVKNHPELIGLKVDAETQYGMSLMRKFKGRYVPYIVLSNLKTGKTAEIETACMIDKVCMERALKGFKD